MKRYDDRIGMRVTVPSRGCPCDCTTGTVYDVTVIVSDYTLKPETYLKVDLDSGCCVMENVNLCQPVKP